LDVTINKYINGKLSGDALIEFELLLKKDKDLQEEVNFHMEVDKALYVNEEVESNENLKALLSNLGKTHILDKTTETTLQTTEGEATPKTEIISENKSILRRLGPFVMLAAAATLLLVLFLILLLH